VRSSGCLQRPSTDLRRFGWLLFLGGRNDVLEDADDFLHSPGATRDLGRGVRLFARDQTEQEYDPCLGHDLDIGRPKLPVSEEIGFDLAGDIGIVAAEAAELAPAICSSFTTVFTCGISLTIFSTSAFACAVGTSPVSNTV